MKSTLKILLTTLVVFVLINCDKNTKDYFSAATPDSVKMVVLFEVDSLVTTEQAAQELRYQFNSLDYPPNAVVWVGGANDSLESFQRINPWRKYIKADNIFSGIHKVRNLFLADSTWLTTPYRGVCYISKFKPEGEVRDSINRYLLWNVYKESDLLSSQGFSYLPFGSRVRKK